MPKREGRPKHEDGPKREDKPRHEDKPKHEDKPRHEDGPRRERGPGNPSGEWAWGVGCGSRPKEVPVGHGRLCPGVENIPYRGDDVGMMEGHIRGFPGISGKVVQFDRRRWVGFPA